MKHFNIQTINQLEKRFRTQLINSLSGFKSVNLLGTQNQNGDTNLAIISSVVHLGADPALIGYICRPATVQRDSYENIIETGYYTFNHIKEDFYQEAHHCSARYPKNVSEFEASGLTPEYLNTFKAPFVQESSIKIGLSFIDQMPIKQNGTILMIGAIEEILIPEDCIETDGYIDIQKAGSITIGGLDYYHKADKLTKLPYAKPNLKNNT